MQATSSNIQVLLGSDRGSASDGSSPAAYATRPSSQVDEVEIGVRSGDMR